MQTKDIDARSQSQSLSMKRTRSRTEQNATWAYRYRGISGRVMFGWRREHETQRRIDSDQSRGCQARIPDRKSDVDIYPNPDRARRVHRCVERRTTDIWSRAVAHDTMIEWWTCICSPFFFIYYPFRFDSNPKICFKNQISLKSQMLFWQCCNSKGRF